MNFREWLLVEELYPQNNTATVYHKTATIENLNSILNNGFTKFERGSFGAGLYTYYKYEDNFTGNFNPTNVGGYGKIIIKMKINDIKRFLVLIEEEAKKIHGTDWLPSAQIKKLKIKVPAGYAETLDEVMTGALKVNIRDLLPSNVNRFDTARGNTIEKLGPLFRNREVAKLAMSKWASSDGQDLKDFQRATAEHPLANDPEKKVIYHSDWDAPLAADDSNCQGIIFYDHLNNGGHNLLIYPRFLTGITFLAYAFIPTSYGVPEKNLKWHSLKNFNANFPTTLAASSQKQKANVDPTNTPFQDDSLKVPNYEVLPANLGLDPNTGEYFGDPTRGNLLHNDTVKASSDLLNLLKGFKTKKGIDQKNAEYKGILSEILKNINILTNFNSTSEILKYLTRFSKYLDSNHGVTPQDFEKNFRFYANYLNKEQYTNLMDALIQVMPTETVEQVANKFLKPEIEYKKKGSNTVVVDNRNANSPVQLFQKIDLYKLIELLNNKNISDDVLSKYVRYVDDQDKLEQIVGKEKYKRLLANQNLYANPLKIDSALWKQYKSGISEIGRMESIQLLRLKQQNGVAINDEDVLHVLNSNEKNLNRLFDFLIKIKYPIKPEWYLYAMRKLGGEKLIQFVLYFYNHIKQALPQIDDEELQKLNHYDHGFEQILLLQRLLPPEKFEKLKDAIAEITRHNFGTSKTVEELKQYADKKPDRISQLPDLIGLFANKPGWDNPYIPYQPHSPYAEQTVASKEIKQVQKYT